MEIKFFIIKATSQEIVTHNIPGRMCILNFADYSRPGGTYDTDFVEWTQEETLCRDIPGLYEALLENEEEYLKGFLYTEFAERRYDVVSCPAPLEGNFEKKAKKVLDAMEEHGVKWPIIGWWGCGVYGRSKKEVLKAFRKIVKEGDYHFRGILWPDPFGEAKYVNTVS